MSNGNVKKTRTHWTSDDEMDFINILHVDNKHADAAQALKVVKENFSVCTLSSLRSRLEKLFNEKRIKREGIAADTYRLMLKQEFKREKKQEKQSKSTSNGLWLPAIACAKVAGYAGVDSVARLGRVGLVKRKKLDDGSFVYDVEAVKVEAAKNGNKIKRAREQIVAAAGDAANGNGTSMYLPAQEAATAA